MTTHAATRSTTTIAHRPVRSRLLAAALAGGALLGAASMASPAVAAGLGRDLPIQACPSPQGCIPVDPTPDPKGPGDLTDRPDVCRLLIDCDGGDLTDRPRPTTPPTQPPAVDEPGDQSADVVVASPSFTG